MFSREKLLIGEDIQKLHDAKIIIFGVGGVGGYTLEMLVRSGIENITIVDYDKVDKTNKNRQIIALDSTIGQYKVDVCYARVKDINPKCNIVTINKQLMSNNIDDFDLASYDYIIDAIDMVSSKIALISHAKRLNIPIISAMGVGNRLGIPEFEITDIYNTSNDGLAKVLRKKLRELGIDKHNVIFCKNNAVGTGEDRTIGSMSYFPAISGCMMASYVINEILK